MKRKLLGALALGSAAAMVGFIAPVTRAASPIVSGFNSNVFLGNDDGTFPAHGVEDGTNATPTPVLQSLGFTVNFFGTTTSGVWVNNNGNVTLNPTYDEGKQSAFTPSSLVNNTAIPIIAPFFADVDTRVGNTVTFGTGTINQAQVGGGTHNAFGVNWPGVGYFSENTSKLNNFQLILIDRSDIGAGDFDIEFNYGQIQWETGDASGGVNGLGAGDGGNSSAYVGYSAGTGAPGTFAQWAGSGVAGTFLDNGTAPLIDATNDGVAGELLFQVRNGTVVNPPGTTSGVPLPSAAWSALALLGMLGLLGVVRARKMA